MAFHWKDRWHFERIGSSVHIYHEVGGQGTDPIGHDVDIEIDSDSWASIVASVSVEGDTALTFRIVKALHGTYP